MPELFRYISQHLACLQDVYYGLLERHRGVKQKHIRQARWAGCGVPLDSVQQRPEAFQGPLRHDAVVRDLFEPGVLSHDGDQFLEIFVPESAREKPGVYISLG